MNKKNLTNDNKNLQRITFHFGNVSHFRLTVKMLYSNHTLLMAIRKIHNDYNDYDCDDMMYNEGLVIIEEGPGISALENSGNALEGKTFCVTGKIKHWKNRDELSAAITAAGGKVTSSVSSKTSYLVNNDINSTSSKNLKAKELNIPIITEEELLAMFN